MYEESLYKEVLGTNEKSSTAPAAAFNLSVVKYSTLKLYGINLSSNWIAEAGIRRERFKLLMVN